jgi:hypothetical protein
MVPKELSQFLGVGTNKICDLYERLNKWGGFKIVLLPKSGIDEQETVFTFNE